MSDGEWQEGSTWEALIFLCHHQLNNLKVLIDHNNLQGFGSTEEVASMSPLWKKLSGFDIISDIIDGHNIEIIRKTIKRKTNLPHFIFLKTKKGNGISFLENQMKWHYLTLNKDQYFKAINELDLI